MDKFQRDDGQNQGNRDDQGKNESASPSPVTVNEQSWALGIHLSALAGLWMPGINVLAPLALWLYKRESSAYLNRQGLEAVNAQLSYTLYMVLTFPLWPILIGIVIFGALIVLNVVVVIMKAIAANNGGLFTYPFVIRFLKK